MKCPTCGYVMDASFETECPRCKRLGPDAMSTGPLITSTPEADNLPSNLYSRNLTEKERARRNGVIRSLERWRWAVIILCIFFGGLAMLFGLFAACASSAPTAFGCFISGIIIIVSGLVAGIILRWMAEMLRVLGRIEKKNP